MDNLCLLNIYPKYPRAEYFHLVCVSKPYFLMGTQDALCPGTRHRVIKFVRGGNRYSEKMSVQVVQCNGVLPFGSTTHRSVFSEYFKNKPGS